MIESSITVIRHGLATLNIGRVKCSILLMLIFFTMQVKSQSVGIGTQNPHPSALLDINSSNAGLLIPRVSLTGIYDSATIVKPARGLLVFNIAEAGQDSVKVMQGYYFFNGTSWQALSIHGNATGDMLYWDGQHWKNLPAGQYGQYLAMCDSIPSWGGCLPKVTTTGFGKVEFTSAEVSALVTNNGGTSLTTRGVVWDTLPNPTIDLISKTKVNGDIGPFTSQLIDLQINTRYYVRAYAQNSRGTSYGESLSFSTKSIDLTSGLIAYYPFSGNAGDSSGNGNHGTVSGAILTTDRKGKAASAYYFSNAAITVPHTASLNLPSNFTIASWVKLDDIVAPNTVQMIFSKHTGTLDGYAYGVWGSPGGQVNFQANPDYSDNTYPGIGGIVSAASWIHLAVTFNSDGAGELKYYLNGNLVSSKVIPFTPIPNTRDLAIGYQSNSVGVKGTFFKGALDELMIFNRTLSPLEIFQLAQQ